MSRTQIDFFFTPHQLGEILAELCPAHGVTIITAVRDSEPRGFRAVPMDAIGDFLVRHHAQSVYLALGSPAAGQPVGDLIQGQSYMTIMIGGADEAKREVGLLTAVGNPDSPIGPFFHDLKQAVIERSHKGMIARDDPNKRVQSIYWARDLEGWKFPGFKPVIPEKEKTDARRTKKKSKTKKK